MSEQDDFLIGNNRLDESLLMDMSKTVLKRRNGETAYRPSGRMPYRQMMRNSSTPRRIHVLTVNQWNRLM